MLDTIGTAATRSQRSLVGWIAKRNGVAHTSEARAAGFTPYDIVGAVVANALIRVRRSWLVTPGCDPRRVAAASVGGRLTCVSAAALKGLWTPNGEASVDGAGDGLIHVAVPGTSGRHPSKGLRLHWGAGPAPVIRNSNEDSILNVLFHTAQCLPRHDALAVWESAIRKGLTDPGVLRGVAWRRAEASAIARVASSLSDSGIETRFLHGMRSAGVRVAQQVWIDGHPLDGLIGASLAIQIDGFAHHSSPADRRRDLAADARLVNRGYVVLRFDYHQVLFAWEEVLDTVLTAMARGAHLRPVAQNR